MSLPHQLRYVLAWDHEPCRAVAGVFVRAVLGSLRRRARRTARSGAVAGPWRFVPFDLDAVAPSFVTMHRRHEAKQAALPAVAE